MAHSITVRLNQAASVFAAGKSTGFGLRGGVKYYDRDAEKELYTNYEAVVFASNPNQIAYYQQVLVEGAIIEISARNQRIKQFRRFLQQHFQMLCICVHQHARYLFKIKVFH